jgi:hypothetical protein
MIATWWKGGGLQFLSDFGVLGMLEFLWVKVSGSSGEESFAVQKTKGFPLGNATLLSLLCLVDFYVL